MGNWGVKSSFLILALTVLLTANVGAVNFELDSISHNSSVTEGEFLNVKVNATNNGNNGSQIINFSLKGEQKDLMRKNLTLTENESKIIEFKYLVRAGEAKENSKFNVSTSTDSVTANLEISTLEKQFKQGWNYFSLPIATQKTYRVSEILDESKINSIWMYEGEWKNYYPKASENDFSQFKAGKGYMVDAEESFTISPIVQNTVENTSDVGESVPASEDIETGWNLVGHYWEVKQSSSSALNTLDTQLGEIYTQSQPGNLGIENLNNNFKTGEAYWIHAGSSSSYARSSHNPRNYQESQLDEIGRIPSIDLQIDDDLYDIYRTRPGKLNVTPREGYLGTDSYMTKQEYIEETEVKVEVKDKNNTVFKTCSGVPNENTSFICDLNTSRYNLSQEYIISYEVSRVGSDVKEQQSDQVSVEYPEIPHFETRLNESFQSGNRLLFESNTGSINITSDDRYYYSEERYLNDTQIKNSVEATVYIQNQTEGSETSYSEPYYYDENFDKENWTKVCESETNSKGNILCGLKNEDLSFPNKYEVAVNVSTKNNLTSNFDSNAADFSVGKMKKIDEKVETSDFWYKLNYFQGIISKDNNDIRNLEASMTLKNKNISVEQSFDGIRSDTEFYTDSGRSENARFYGPSNLRKGEIQTGSRKEEMLASEEPAFFRVTIETEDNRKRLATFVYNVSDYAQSELALVPESDRYNASEIAENEEVRLNVSNITEGYNNGNYELSAKMFLENKNMTYNDNNVTDVNLIPLNSNGRELSEYRRTEVLSAELGQNKTQRGGIEVSNTTETEYLLAQFNYGNRGRNKPLFVYNVNRSELE